MCVRSSGGRPDLSRKARASSGPRWPGLRRSTDSKTPRYASSCSASTTHGEPSLAPAGGSGGTAQVAASSRGSAFLCLDIIIIILVL